MYDRYAGKEQNPRWVQIDKSGSAESRNSLVLHRQCKQELGILKIVESRASASASHKVPTASGQLNEDPLQVIPP